MKKFLTILLVLAMLVPMGLINVVGADGEYTVKRVEIGENSARLMPANENNRSYKPIEITPENNFMIWGIVTWVIKKM